MTKMIQFCNSAELLNSNNRNHFIFSFLLNCKHLANIYHSILFIFSRKKFFVFAKKIENLFYETTSFYYLEAKQLIKKKLINSNKFSFQTIALWSHRKSNLGKSESSKIFIRFELWFDTNRKIKVDFKKRNNFLS